MSYTQMACECGSGCDDGAVSRLLNITVQVEERDTSIITCFCRHITISEEDDVVKLATRWNRRKEKSLGGIFKEGCSSRSSEEYYATAAA
eukprot:scaffold4286_cov139-Skeletonema_dohrnii-CCMP3373.AAC.1